MLGGYTGKILRVDLTQKKMKIEKPDEATARSYIGGAGMAARILWDETTAATDPLSPENPLVFMAGPLTGTSAPSSSRYTVAALSPLTGIWGEAHAGGGWADEMKHAGFDGIIFNGRSEKPVYLWLNEGKAEIKDAGHLWGKDTYDVSKLVQGETDAKASIAAIGRAGEKRVRIACIMNDGKAGRAAARCGLGAVMGSKNLKAVAVKGTAKPHIDNEQMFQQALEEVYPKLTKPKAEGEDFFWFWKDGGGMPVKNWSQGKFESFNAKCLAKWQQSGKPYFCRGCRSNSCHESKLVDGRRRIVGETLMPLGSNCLIDNYEALDEAFDMCQRYGLDGISTGGVMAFAMELFDNGLISKRETGGLELNWGNHEAMLEMVRMIGEREGFGEVLGDGVKRAAERVGGIAQEYAIHVKGLEFPQHDPRTFNSLAVGYATANRGADHLEGHTYAIERSKAPCRELGFPEITGRFETDQKAEMNVRYQDFMCMLDSLVSCHFLYTSTGVMPSCFAGWLNAVTGWDMGLPEFLMAGERIFNLKRMINVRRGISRKDDTLPPRILTHSRGQGWGRSATNIPWLGKMLEEYYALRGWSEEGIPTRAKLAALGLTDVAKAVPIRG